MAAGYTPSTRAVKESTVGAWGPRLSLSWCLMLGPGASLRLFVFGLGQFKMMMEYVLARVDEKHGAQAFVEVFYGVGGA